MALNDRKVRVTVTCTDREVRATVRPWAAHVKENQRVKWTAHGRVDDLRIVTSSAKSARIFTRKPKVSRNGKSAISGRRKEYSPASDGRRIPYSISLHFTDNKGRRRAAMIDPDMVIDS